MSESSADAAPHPGLAALLADYGVAPPHYDESCSTPGQLRGHWEAFAREVGLLGPRQLASAQARVDRQLHDNGVTYNVYASSDGPTRPWSLDVVPLIIAGDEWDHLALGLRRRARLLNQLCADVYGPQQLLRDGLVPPALILAHPGFLRACHGVMPADGVWLHQAAFDLARGPDGAWRVIGTRTQSPSGTGYALENRIAISRLYPAAFRHLHVERFAPFFQHLQDSLADRAPTEGEPPHVVLLTPGPFNETYFEHAYLARHLGFTLAEGSDLAVRNDRVYLKTVTGLKRVHAILRRLDDDFCDPVELRSDSTLGVPGLVQAWRRGEVLIANGLGTGVLESPGLLGFLPAIAEHVLGMSLDVPSVATWWCGERAAFEAARERIGSLVLKRALPHRSHEPVFMADLDDAGREAWLARVEASPESFVFEEFLPLSHAPSWQWPGLEGRAVMLRVYLLADGHGDYTVLPGGLTRVAGADRHVVSSQQGGSSKDTWILGAAPVDHAGPSRLRSRVDDPVLARVVSSRAAEHLFWLGRYAERSEHGARLLRATLSRAPDGDDYSPLFWRTVRQVAARQGLVRESPDRRVADESPVALSDAGLDEPSVPFGLAASIAQTVSAARAVRDRLSSDTWRLLQELDAAQHASGAEGLVETLDRLDRRVITLVAVAGLEMAHMTRDDGWRFLSLGRHLERAQAVATTLAEVAAWGGYADPQMLEWLLDLSDSAITYRSRYRRVPDWSSVTELLVFDQSNPRSLSFQLAKLAKHVVLLPEASLGPFATRLNGAANLPGTPDQAQGALFERDDSVEAFLRESARTVAELSDALTLRYFSHAYELAQATAVL